MDIKKIVIKIYQEVTGFPLIVRCIFGKIVHPNKNIILKGFFIFKKGKLANFNWGDDLNYYFFRMITNKKILLLPDTKLAEKLPFKNYLCIGSTIMSFDMRNTIVWGAGLLNDKLGFKVKSKPKQILAVRGPLTRKWLLEQGIDCSEVYGDPALLLPIFLKPQVTVCYKVGIIPHYIDINNKVVNKISKWENTKIIKISGFNDWKEFVNLINSCDFIISSSLHGVIVSEAYGVPVIWSKFEGTNYVPGWDFKFHDFFESIDKPFVEPVKINEKTSLDEMQSIANKWCKANINIDSLLNTCPFKLNEKPPMVKK